MLNRLKPESLREKHARLWKFMRGKKEMSAAFNSLVNGMNIVFPGHVINLSPENLAAKIKLLHDLNVEHGTKVFLDDVATSNFHYSFERVKSDLLEKITEQKVRLELLSLAEPKRRLAEYVSSPRVRSSPLIPSPREGGEELWLERPLREGAPPEQAKTSEAPLDAWSEMDKRFSRGGDLAEKMAKLVKRVYSGAVARRHIAWIRESLDDIQAELKTKNRALSADERALLEGVLNRVLKETDSKIKAGYAVRREDPATPPMFLELPDTIKAKLKHSEIMSKIREQYVEAYALAMAKISDGWPVR